MKLCMFHPRGVPLERGWVGRVDGDRVVHLAAQTLQSFFLGGGRAREHAEFPLEEVTFLAPVPHPPVVRVFDAPHAFSFANASAITGSGSTVMPPSETLSLVLRLALVVADAGRIGGYSIFVECQAPGLPAPKDRDFGLILGPVVVTPDECEAEDLAVTVRGSGEDILQACTDRFEWDAAVAHAEAGTVLRPGDVVAGPAFCSVPRHAPSATEIEVGGIGTLRVVLGVA